MAVGENDTCITSRLVSRMATASLRVYNGTSCSDLNCSFPSRIRNDEDYFFRAKRGVHYWFRVSVGQITSKSREQDYAIRLEVSLGARLFLCIKLATITYTFDEILIYFQGEVCPENNECTTAKAINNLPYAHSGSIDFATKGNFSSIAAENSCSPDIKSSNSPTLWFTVVGTGSCITATLADDFDGALILFSGIDCKGESLKCEATSSQKNGAISWPSVIGQVYRIALTSLSDVNDEPITGQYNLVVEERSDCRQFNDVCSNATKIERLPYITTGNTANVVVPDTNQTTSNHTNSSCSTIDQKSPILYYELAGTGCVSASLTSTSFSASLGLYTGDHCNSSSATCQYETADGDNIVTWLAEEGITYRLAVGSRIASGGSSNGTFTLGKFVKWGSIPIFDKHI